MIDIKDSVVTIDAMGTQKTIATKIIDNGGEYILALKGNQSQMVTIQIPHLSMRVFQVEGY